MEGILLIDKPKGITSRDVVNQVCKLLKTKKVGHTGTLDPIATGVLVLCVGKYTKLVDLITNYEKEYIATAQLGIETDTLDITGNVIREEKVDVSKSLILKVLNSFKGKYLQEVPSYSAVKINGKKLYEYARNNEEIELPKREVEIKNIELLEYNEENSEIKFKVLVSKGTYIRSLIRDIGIKLNVPITMSELRRTKQGKFNIKECYDIEEIENNNFKFLNIKDVLNDKIHVIDDESLLKQIKNGAIIKNEYNSNDIMFQYNNEIIAIYKTYEKDNNMLKPYKMFL